jgi:hypothetical protein
MLQQDTPVVKQREPYEWGPVAGVGYSQAEHVVKETTAVAFLAYTIGLVFG